MSSSSMAAPTNQRKTRAGTALIGLLGYAVLLAGLASIPVMAWLVISGYSAFPYADQWDFLDPLARAHGAANWHLLWAQHMEHRIVVPQFFYLIDLFLAGGKNLFLLASIFSLQLMEFAAWIAAFRRLSNFRGPVLGMAIGFASFCLFRQTQIENFIWGFQVCFIVPMVAAVFAFCALLHAHSTGAKREQAGWIGLAIFLAVVASFSLANGLLVAPLLFFMAWVLRMERRWQLGIAFAGIVASATYFVGFHLKGGMVGVGQRSLTEMAESLLYYFGVSWEQINVKLGMAAAAVGVLVFVGLALLTIVGRFRASRFQLLLLTTGLFAIGTGVMTVIGRGHYGLAFLHASRYQSVAMFFWLSAGLLALDLICGAEARPTALGIGSLQASFLILMALSATTIPGTRETVVARKRMLNTATLALVTRAADASLADQVPPPMHFSGAEPALGMLREMHAWVFSDPFFRVLGERLTQEYDIAPPNECSGAITSVEAIAGDAVRGSRVSGWAMLMPSSQPAERILLVGSEETVIGLGRGSGQGDPFPRASNGPMTSRPEWFGFLSPAREPARISAYVVLNDGHRACPLPSAMP